jgi:hypothetical protein
MKIEAKQNKSTHLVQSIAPKSELAGDSIKRMEQLVRSVSGEPRGLLHGDCSNKVTLGKGHQEEVIHKV